MMPLWVYIVGGILSVWAFLGLIAVGVWLFDEHEDLAVTLLGLVLTVALGAIIGKGCHGEMKKRLDSQPRPPAEAPVQP